MKLVSKDIDTLGVRSWAAFETCRNAGAHFQDLLPTVASLHTALKQLADEIDNEESLLNRRGDGMSMQLGYLLNNSSQGLEELEGLLYKYSTLGSQVHHVRSGLSYGEERLRAIDKKLSNYASTLSKFIRKLKDRPSSRSELVVDGPVNDVQESMPQPPVLPEVATEDSRWTEIEKKLKQDGMNSAEFENSRSWISAMFQAEDDLTKRNSISTSDNPDSAGTSSEPVVFWSTVGRHSGTSVASQVSALRSESVVGDPREQSSSSVELSQNLSETVNFPDAGGIDKKNQNDSTSNILQREIGVQEEGLFYHLSHLPSPSGKDSASMDEYLHGHYRPRTGWPVDSPIKGESEAIAHASHDPQNSFGISFHESTLSEPVRNTIAFDHEWRNKDYSWLQEHPQPSPRRHTLASLSRNQSWGYTENITITKNQRGNKNTEYDLQSSPMHMSLTLPPNGGPGFGSNPRRGTLRSRSAIYSHGNSSRYKIDQMDDGNSSQRRWTTPPAITRPEEGIFEIDPGEQTPELKIVEHILPCSLEELFHGKSKRISIRHNQYDQAGFLCEGRRILEVPLKKGLVAGYQFYCTLVDDETMGPKGDVHFTVAERKHPVFTREGEHLFAKVKITLTEALCGWNRTITSLCGTQTYVGCIKPTPADWSHRALGLGMPYFDRPSERGDLIISVHILHPKALSISQRLNIASALKNVAFEDG